MPCSLLITLLFYFRIYSRSCFQISLSFLFSFATCRYLCLNNTVYTIHTYAVKIVLWNFAKLLVRFAIISLRKFLQIFLKVRKKIRQILCFRESSKYHLHAHPSIDYTMFLRVLEQLSCGVFGSIPGILILYPFLSRPNNTH